MQMKERSEAIQRAQRALKALGEHPRSRKKELGHAARAPQLRSHIRGRRARVERDGASGGDGRTSLRRRERPRKE